MKMLLDPFCSQESVLWSEYIRNIFSKWCELIALIFIILFEFPLFPFVTSESEYAAVM